MTDTGSTGTALVITSNFGTEADELIKTTELLKNKGVEVTVAAVSDDPVQTLRGDHDLGPEVKPDTTLSKVSAGDYDVLVVPGGTINADVIRVTDDAVALAKAFSSAKKPIAAICHAPWLLVNSGLAKDRTLTSYFSVSDDLKNAGATWVDQAVQVDEGNFTLITSRNPGDIEVFVDAIVTALES